MELNRRHFLASLMTVGATLALPVAVAKATPAQVNTAWIALLNDPWYFDVNESDTITTVGLKEPEIRSDVFDADLSDHCTVDSLISDIEACWPLTSLFQELAAAELEETLSNLEGSDDLSLMEHRRLKRLAEALDNERDGWSAWMRLEGAKGLPRFKDEVEDWLASAFDYNDYEWFPRNATSQGAALEFFASVPHETLKALGVVIVEGDHPGSTYFAAELRQPTESANAAAELLKLPFRFRAVGSGVLVTNSSEGA
jgi:hypothetical protein|nr:hypothetical protein [Rhodoferax sp.]